MSKKDVAKNLILREIKSLKFGISEGLIGSTDFCNHSKNNKCEVYGYDCKVVDKICMDFEVNELLNEVDEIVSIIENSLNPPVLENKCVDEKEMINHPQHYNMGKFEAIDVIEDWKLNFNLGNTVKYISRAGHKDNIIQDLKKSLWYLQREINRLEKGE